MGAIYVSSSIGNVEILNTTIDNSNAFNNGGSIILRCDTVLISGVNINNSNVAGSWTFTPLNPQNNYQRAYGGAIYLVCNSVIISNTVITNAKASGLEFLHPEVPPANLIGLGGGVYWVDTDSLTIINSRFENCTAYTAGGAIFPVAGSPGLTLTNTQFINCSP